MIKNNHFGLYKINFDYFYIDFMYNINFLSFYCFYNL